MNKKYTMTVLAKFFYLVMAFVFICIFISCISEELNFGSFIAVILSIGAVLILSLEFGKKVFLTEDGIKSMWSFGTNQCFIKWGQLRTIKWREHYRGYAVYIVSASGKRIDLNNINGLDKLIVDIYQYAPDVIMDYETIGKVSEMARLNNNPTLLSICRRLSEAEQ